MKKVLIISYFFPPCNLTASQRPSSWARYLSHFGYYPIIITRRWDHKIAHGTDISRSTAPEIIHEVKEGYEVYALPYQGNLKDQIYSRHGDSKWVWLRKILSFLEAVFQNFFLSAIPYNNIHKFSLDFLKKNPDIKKVVITANPFQQFYFGYLLKKATGITWIADYRDDWSTTEINNISGFLRKLIWRIEARSEKKWVSNAAMVTTVSPYYLEKITNFTGKSGAVLLNGFNPEDQSKITPLEKKDEFTITYNGTLYATQQIEIFLTGYKLVVDRYKGQIKFRLQFPGLAFDKTQSARVKQIMQGYEDLLIITERVSKDEVFDFQNRSHLFLMLAHAGQKGIPSSKLYEYLLFQKPIMLCPGDNDIIQQTLADTNLGLICNSADEVFKTLGNLVEFYIKNGRLPVEPNADAIMKYSRKSQSQVLAQLLDKI